MLSNNTTNFHTYIQKQHRFIRQTQANTTYTFIQKHIHKRLYNIYIYKHGHESFMHKKEQYIINNKHVEYERSLTKYDNYK